MRSTVQCCRIYVQRLTKLDIASHRVLAHILLLCNIASHVNALQREATGIEVSEGGKFTGSFGESGYIKWVGRNAFVNGSSNAQGTIDAFGECSSKLPTYYIQSEDLAKRHLISYNW